jgi:hypothetical protein
MNFMEYVGFMDNDPVYEDAPICNINICLHQHVIYCTTDCHKITPNSIKCERVIYAREV